MIAEMRSYGQGVMIAEQIPTKLAPDVIKNTSNKIIQRLVAADDQNLVASTIGLNDKDALYIGSLTVGEALCHKEGMSLPVKVTINPIEENIVPNAILFIRNIGGRLHRINSSIVKECIADDIDLQAIRLLNSILIQNYEFVQKSVERSRNKTWSEMKKKNMELIQCGDANAIYAELFPKPLPVICYMEFII